MKISNGIDQFIENAMTIDCNNCGRTVWVLFYWDKLKPQHINSQVFNDKCNAEVVQIMRATRFNTKLLQTLI